MEILHTAVCCVFLLLSSLYDLFHFARCCIAQVSFFKHMTSRGNEATSAGLLQCQFTSEIRDYKQKHNLRSTYRRQATYSCVPGISVCQLYRSMKNLKHPDIVDSGQYK
jgi:hypothetical protein